MIKHLTRAQMKRGNYANLLAADKTYLDGELVLIQDRDRLVEGDDVTAFSSLISAPLNPLVLSISSNQSYDAADLRSGIVSILATTGSSSDIEVELPDPSTLFPDSVIKIIKVDSGTARLDITAASGNISGLNNVYLVEQFNTITLVTDGTNYLVLDSNIKYTEDWQNATDWTNVEFPVAHGLGQNLPDLEVDIYLSSTGSDTDATLYRPVTITYDQASPSLLAVYQGLIPLPVDTDNIKIQTGANGVQFIKDNSFTQTLGASTSWYIKIVVKLRFP